MRFWLLVVLAACGTETLVSNEQLISGGGGGGTTPLPPIDVATIAKTSLAAPSGYPAQFKLWGNSTVQRADFFVRAAASFDLASTDAMVATQTVQAPTNLAITTYQLTSNGIPVENARYDLIERDGNLVAGAGHLAPGLALSPTPSITPAAASAVAMPPGATYHWQFIPGATQPAGDLTFYSADLGATQPFKLVYRFAYATTTASYVAHVDATTGALVDRVRTDERLIAIGTKYDGTSVVMNTFEQWPSPPLFFLKDVDNGHNIETFDFDEAAATMSDFADGDNIWGEPANRRGVSAHWAAEKAWDYLASLGFKGVDGIGASVLQLAANNKASTCAFTMPYTAGQMTVLCNQDLDLESVAHEIGHQVVNNRGMLANAPESDAIDEGLADLFATSVNRFVIGNDNDWLLFDSGGSPSTTWRDIANPKTHGQPDTYGSAMWNVESAKTNPDGHVLAGVITKWFYLLAHGGTGTNDVGGQYSVVGIGRSAAEKIVLMAMANASVLGTAPKILDLRRLTITNAELLYGEGEPEVAAAIAAWDAVNVVDWSSMPPIWRSPADGAEAVAPWPTSFRFETPFCSGGRCATETAWLVEYSTDPAFGTAQQVLVTGQAYQGTKIISSAFANLRPATVYYWRAKAQYAGGTWSSTWRFTSRFMTGRQQPRNCSPASMAPWGASLTWDPVDGATGYEVEVARDAAFTDLLAPFTAVTNPSWAPKLPIRAKVYWRVRAVGPASTRGDYATSYDAAGTTAPKVEQETKWASINALSVQTTDMVPANATPYPPGTYAHPFSVNLGVTPNGASSYELKYADFAMDCSGNAGTLVSAPSGTATIPVKPNTPVYWCGRAVGYHNDRSSWTPLYTVHVDGGAPGGLSPNGSIPVPPWPVMFKWLPVAGCDHYDVEVSNNSNVTSPFLTFQVDCLGPPQWPANVPVNSAPVYWRVRAVDAANTPSAWAYASFHVDQGATKPQLTAPLGIVNQKQVTFTWMPVPGATHYRVRVWNDNNPSGSLIDAMGTSATTSFIWGVDLLWTVQAYSAEGYVGAESDIGAFSVQEPASSDPAQAPICFQLDVPIGPCGLCNVELPVQLSSYSGRTVWAKLTFTSATATHWWWGFYSYAPTRYWESAAFDWLTNTTSYAYFTIPQTANDLTLNVEAYGNGYITGNLHVEGRCP